MIRIADAVQGAIAATLMVALSACGGAITGEHDEIDVFAAASLTDVLPRLETSYTESRRTPTRTTLAGSQALVAQILDGAPADVIVTADRLQMDRLQRERDLAAPPAPIATNDVVIAVPRANPNGIDGIDDLDDGDLTIVLPAPEVPAGAYAAEVLARAGVQLSPASLEPSVRAALSRVVLGEADAAIVYATDAASADEVIAVPVPGGTAAATYYAAALTASGVPFVVFLESPHGRAVLEDAGFGVPETAS